MIRCDGDRVEMCGSSHELIDEFIAVCRALAVVLRKAKAKPDTDVWAVISRMVALARSEKYKAEIIDMSALGKIGGRGDDR